MRGMPNINASHHISLYHTRFPSGTYHRGVPQERIEKHKACEIVSYAYGIILRRYEIPGICVVVPVAACMYHTAAETRRPTDRRVR